MTYTISEIYIGECKQRDDGEWIREGRGIHIVSENERRDGFWVNDELDGAGRIIETSGNCYQG